MRSERRFYLLERRSEASPSRLNGTWQRPTSTNTAGERGVPWRAHDTRCNTVVADAQNIFTQTHMHTPTHKHKRNWKMQAQLSIGVTVFFTARCCLWSEYKSGNEIDLFVLIARSLTHPPSGGILDSRIKRHRRTHFYNPIWRDVWENVSPLGSALFASMFFLDSIFFCESPSVNSQRQQTEASWFLWEGPNLQLQLGWWCSQGCLNFLHGNFFFFFKSSSRVTQL